MKLYERRRGRDRFVGKDDTMSGSAAGYFSIKGRLTRGTYYVKVRRQVLQRAGPLPRLHLEEDPRSLGPAPPGASRPFCTLARS